MPPELSGLYVGRGHPPPPGQPPPPGPPSAAGPPQPPRPRPRPPRTNPSAAPCGNRGTGRWFDIRRRL